MKKKRMVCLCLVFSLLLGGCGVSSETVKGEAVKQEAAEAGKGSAEGAKETETTEADFKEEASAEEAFYKEVPEMVPMEDNYRTYYEVFLYSFYDSDGDGIGDLKGLTEKLDYINDGDPATHTDLGCNGIWLMPIMPSPTYHKYDVTDYYGIDKAYGTMEDFDAFMAACNERGIKVILDLVLNHSSSQHPWFQEACAYLKELGDGEPDLAVCPYVDYYHFSREAKGGYSSVPGSDVWYYEAQFWSEMPDLNLENEALRKEIESIVDFWLAKGVGGFRLDAVKEYVSGTVDANVDILTWFVSMVKEKKQDAYLVGEVWTDLPTYSKYYDSGIDSIFAFSFADSGGMIANAVKGASGASSYGKGLEYAQEACRKHKPDYIDAPFYTNHDMGRSAGYYSGEYSQAQTKISGALNLLMSGSAFVYYGEELGMKGAGKDENKRAPMYFSKDPKAKGMCSGPVGMDNIKMKYGSLEEQQKEPDSVYQYYKKAIYLRNLHPAIRKGSVTNLEAYSSENVTAFTKTCGEETLTIFCNLSPEEAVIELQDAEKDLTLATGLYTDEEEASLQDGNLTLPSYGIVLLKTK